MQGSFVTTQEELARSLEKIGACTEHSVLDLQILTLVSKIPVFVWATRMSRGEAFSADNVDALAHELDAVAAVLRAGAEKKRSLR